MSVPKLCEQCATNRPDGWLPPSGPWMCEACFRAWFTCHPRRNIRTLRPFQWWEEKQRETA